MTSTLRSSTSLRRRLNIVLIGGAAVLALLIFLFVRHYTTQIAQQGQDNILKASVSSILDAAVIRNGALEIDFPYAALSMLNTASDDRVFYAIYQDGALLSGYEALPPAGSESFNTISRYSKNFSDTAVYLSYSSLPFLKSAVAL